MHWRFPTAPPRLAGVGLEDTLRRLSGIDIGAPGSAGLSDPVAAVPSLHAGWALGVGVGLVVYAQPLAVRAVGVLYPAAVVVTIIVTGNHFVFDALAGMLVIAAGFGLACHLARPAVVDFRRDAGWSSQVARRAHNPEVAGSNPAPAMAKLSGAFCFLA